jgi:DNA-binding Lrp family transcriptional regulator
MVDEVDLKILSAIDTNARITYSKLSKQLNLSKSKTQYRLNSLIKEGIIKKFVTQPSLNKLGFFLAKFYLVLSGMNLEEKAAFFDSLYKEDKICWVAKTQGQWDVMIGVFVRNVNELLKIKKEILSKYGNYIESIDLSLLGEGYTSQRKYLFPINQNFSKTIKDYAGTNFVQENLSDNEKKILKLISNNARFNYVDVCEKTKMDVKTIKKRIKQLEEKNIIQGYVTFLDIKKLGYQFFKICIYLKNQEELEKIINFGINHPNVVHVIEVIGSWELEFEVETKSFDELFKIEDELKNKFSKSIKKTVPIIIEEEIKLDFIPSNL